MEVTSIEFHIHKYALMFRRGIFSDGLLSYHAGEYHQYDFLVYPKITKVAKGFFDQVMETGKGVMNALFGRSSAKKPAQDANEVDYKTLPTEAMVKQCLQFYLEPYKKLLLQDGEFPAGFRVDRLVKEVTHLYLQHQKPRVKHRDGPAQVSVEHIPSVSCW